MNFKGTPGPWYVEGIVGICTPIVHSGEGLGYCPPVLAKVTTRYSSAEQAKCNANLIAAAPELLEALQDMLSGWQYIRTQHGDLYGVGWDRAEQKAFSAINKALGVKIN